MELNIKSPDGSTSEYFPAESVFHIKRDIKAFLAAFVAL